MGEAHFTQLGISAPEVVYGAVATRTSRIKLRSICIPLLAFNHPIRVAERIATLDCLSEGRAELGVGRSNDLVTLQAFEIDPKQTRKQWSESLEVVVKALTQDPFEHDGEIWHIPPRTMYPRPLQKPHPPIFNVSSSVDGCERAGKNGLGVICASLPGSWEYLQHCHDTYRAAVLDANPPGGHVNNSFTIASLRTHCAETVEQARKEAHAAVLRSVDNLRTMYRRLTATPDYGYMSDIVALLDDDDLNSVMDRAPVSFSIGDPDFFIERCRRFQEIGVDEFCMNLDAIGHEEHLKAIELVGKYVIPEFRASRSEPSVH
jgi:alkanesulfonate monooxygenase SsuD/methylene tetrahydromethanopterin reductase-like flavin-dependent oxidoreductase (luciferase family)